MRKKANQQQQQTKQQHQLRKAAPEGNCCSSVSTSLKNNDMFSVPFSLRIDGGDDAIRSFLGTTCSFLLLLITAFYGGLKMKVLQDRNDVNILVAKKDLFYTDDDIFSYENDKLNLAVAFTGYNNDEEYELPPEYGRLVINAFKWGSDPVTGEVKTERTELDAHNCWDRELGLGMKGADDE